MLPRACCFTNQGACQWCFCSCTGLAKQNLARCLQLRRLPALQRGQPQPGRTESGEGAGFICPCKRVAVQGGSALLHIYNFRISSLKHCSHSSTSPPSLLRLFGCLQSKSWWWCSPRSCWAAGAQPPGAVWVPPEKSVPELFRGL